MINLCTVYTINYVYMYVNFEFISIVLEKFINSLSYKIGILVTKLRRCILLRVVILSCSIFYFAISFRRYRMLNILK